MWAEIHFPKHTAEKSKSTVCINSSFPWGFSEMAQDLENLARNVWHWIEALWHRGTVTYNSLPCELFYCRNINWLLQLDLQHRQNRGWTRRTNESLKTGVGRETDTMPYDCLTGFCNVKVTSVCFDFGSCSLLFITRSEAKIDLNEIIRTLSALKWWSLYNI